LTPLLSSARSVPNQSAREETPGTSGTPVAASAQTIPNSSSLPSLGGNPKSPYAFLVSLADVKLPGATFVERLRGFVSKVTSLPTSPWSFFHGTESSSSVRDEDYYFNADTGQRVQSLEDVYADEYADIEVDMLLASKEWRCVAADHPSNTSGRPYFMNKALSVTTWNLQEWLKEH
jgi:hypothetical protein